MSSPQMVEPEINAGQLKGKKVQMELCKVLSLSTASILSRTNHNGPRYVCELDGTDENRFFV